jgi:hypothetical protein
MRKTPIFPFRGSAQDWLKEHSSVLYKEVLDSVECAVRGEYSLSAIPVVIIESDQGTVLFALKSTESTFESLKKAEEWFVSLEEYENANRALQAQKKMASRLEEETKAG